MEDIRKVTEEDMKNLFWQQTLHTIRQDKLIAVLTQRLKEAERDSGVLEFKQANA